MVRISLENKRQIVASCIAYHKEACKTPRRHEFLEAIYSTL